MVMRQLREHHRFMRGLSVWVGFKQTGVQYDRHERYAGTTQYPLRKMVKFASDAITGFSYAPIQWVTTLGFWISLIALLSIPVVAALRFFYSATFFTGQASTLIAVLFMGGVQLISVGILGEYLGRIYEEVKKRPLYIVREAPPKPELVEEPEKVA
jgi:dolichol-phosphate mannosyltransferase